MVPNSAGFKVYQYLVYLKVLRSQILHVVSDDCLVIKIKVHEIFFVLQKKKKKYFY